MKSFFVRIYVVFIRCVILVNKKIKVYKEKKNGKKFKFN